MSALSYMQRRASGTYEFRRPLPKSLAGKPTPPHMRDAFPELINLKTGCFKRELVRSLKTKDVKEAKRLNHRESHRVARLFDDAEEVMVAGPMPQTPSGLTEAELADISREIMIELLQADEAERVEGDDRRRLQTEEDRQQWPNLESPVPLAPNMPDTPLPAPHVRGMAKDHHLRCGDLLEELEEEFREAYARRDPSIVNAETRTALKRRRLSLDPSVPHYWQVGMAVLEGTVTAYNLMRRKQAGEVIQPMTQTVTAHSAQASLQVADRGPKLSDAFASWKAGGIAKGARVPNANTVVEAEQALRYFTQLHGDINLGDITREKARQYRDAVARVPSNLPRKLRKLPLPQLLECDLAEFRARNATTVHKLLALLGAVISQAEREGHLDKVPGFVNPFGKGIRYALQRGEKERTLFDGADLQAIFTSPVFTDGKRPMGGGGESAFWFPPIGLLSGMRLEEMAQLRICDLRQDQETNRWFFDISREGGRTTKTASSIRRVPLHCELERIGLLCYRQSLLDAGAKHEDSLWPDVRADGDRARSSAWSKWFGRYLREKCGIKDSAKVFHSLRHTFKRMTRDAGLPEEIHDALTGHAGTGSVGRSYGKGFSIGPLMDAMDMVLAPIDLSGLQWARR